MQDHHVARVAALFEQVASEYDQHVAFFSAYGEKLVDWTDVGAGELLLDIGTGRGAVATSARARGARVVGLDIAAEMLRRGSGPRIRGDARTLPIRGAQFDLAVGAFSIHLLPDPVAGMTEAARATRRGGRVVVALGGRFASPEWGRFDPEVRARVEAELLGHLRALHRNGGITLRRAATFAEGRVP